MTLICPEVVILAGLVRTGNSGPPPKPEDERIRANNLSTLPPSTFQIPECPARIGGLKPLVDTVTTWDQFRTSDAANWIQSHHMPSVLRLFGLYDEAERSFRAYRRKRLISGSQGQAVRNPAWESYKQAITEARALEDRLGLNPLSGLRLNIDAGAAGKAQHELKKLMDLYDHPDDEPAEDPRGKNRPIDVDSA